MNPLDIQSIVREISSIQADFRRSVLAAVVAIVAAGWALMAAPVATLDTATREELHIAQKNMMVKANEMREAEAHYSRVVAAALRKLGKPDGCQFDIGLNVVNCPEAEAGKAAVKK